MFNGNIYFALYLQILCFLLKYSRSTVVSVLMKSDPLRCIKSPDQYDNLATKSNEKKKFKINN